MSVSASTSTSSVPTLSAKTGIGGLVSGMDTDELVKGLTTSSRAKIAKEGQNIQSLEWKQTGYRAVTKALKEFQNKYLDVLSKTNMRSTSFYNTVAATSLSSKISVSATSTANEGSITINSISQLATKQTVQGDAAVTSPLGGILASSTPEAITTLLDNIKGKSVLLKLDGQVKTITFDDAFVASVEANKTAQGLENAIQGKADTAFGMKTAIAHIIDVSVTNDKLSFAATGSQLTVNALNADTATLGFLGLKDGQSNKLDTGKSLADLGFETPLETVDSIFKTTINGVKFEFNETDSLSTVMSRINAGNAGVMLSYSSITDQFTMSATKSGVGENIVVSEEQGNLFSALRLTSDTGAVDTKGQNAILTVNDVEISRSTNDIEIDGVKISLLEKTELSDPAISVTMKQDGSALLDPIKSFVEDYNSLMDMMNGLVKETKDSAYQPLTDDQKEDMSEKQIETWETKAKIGLLSGDPLLRGIASQMQSMIYGSAVKGGISLYDLGITSAGYSENGKLKIDEAKLKTALETNGTAIKELFTTESTGLANKLNDIISGATKTTGGSGYRGSLIEMAGYEKTFSDTENNITKSIDKSNKLAEKLKLYLKDEESRIWNKFTAMEAAIQRLNTQGAMLTQFSSNG